MSDQEKKCNDYGDRPGCLGSVDPEWTMDFTEVEPDGYIYWCSFCGPEAHAMDAAIMQAFEERGVEFISEFAAALFEMRQEAKTKSH